ncbi:MAG: C40 family peptidase [Flavobacteriales bacterium]|nr:C40 family peptidase [Flavobacteriales bacterium]MCB9335274.1 C40 family peptidase [Flavobacteriales bacterium]
MSLLFYSCNSQKKAQKKEAETHKVIQKKYADLLNVSTTEIKNVRLYAFIEEWTGTPYKYGGLSKSGIDCSGFCNVLYNQVYQKELPRTTKDIAKQLDKVKQSRLEEGDLVLFNIEGKKNAHVGVYLQNNMFVHASTSKGVIISSLENPYYKKAYNKGGKV